MAHPNPQPLKPDWTLEVVRGARVGQAYPLAGPDLILGNGTGVDGSTFVGLADQEGASPRRMADAHATLSRSASGSWTVRDRNTPGGTFVNNRRVLPGVSQPIAEGDVIQLGSVQLRLARIGPATSINPTTSIPFDYRSPTSGTRCRSWDDFLTFSAQRWEELRDDLVSGRLASFAASVARPDLAPPESRLASTPEHADERLDAWLARLTTTADSKPELDVHPLKVTIALASGGVTVRRKIRVANVGHRLLRVMVAPDPADSAKLSVGPPFQGREIVVRDFVDVPFDVVVPDPIPGPMVAHLVVGGVGSEKRVRIEVDQRLASTEPAATSGTSSGDPGSATVAALFARFDELSSGQRVVLGGLVSGIARLVVGIVGGAIGEGGMVASSPEVPKLGGEVFAMAIGGALIFGAVTRRLGGWRDLIWGVVAGAGMDALLASLIVAACRAIEPMLGPWAASPVAVLGLWTGPGAGLAFLTTLSKRTAINSARGAAR